MKNNLSLKIKIQSLVAFFTILFFVIFTVFIYTAGKQDMSKNQNIWISKKVETINNFINIQIDDKQKDVNAAMKVAHYLFYKNGKIKEDTTTKRKIVAVNQHTHKKHTVYVNKWMLEDKELHKTFSMVDKIKKMSVETATIFQKIDKGYLRISTNVMKLDGTRAVGTFIPNSSKVIKTCERGETYIGRAYVVNDWYRTAYEPIYINGEIKGILYVGVKEKKLESLNKFFNQKDLFKTSTTYLIEKKGNILINGNKDIKTTNGKDKIFFKEAIKDNKESGRIEYIDENNKEKIEFYRYNEKIDSYVIFNMEKEEFFEGVDKLFYGLLLGEFIILILLIAGNALILGKLFHNFNKLSTFSKKISEGKLNYKLDYYKNDEIGNIGNSLKILLENYRKLVAVVKLISKGKLVEADRITKELVAKLNDTDKKNNEFYDALIGMISQLNKIVGEIQIGAENIANASLTIKDVSGSLADGANIQASSAEEVSSAMEEMLAIISQTAENARIADKIVVEAATEINSSSKSFKVTTEAMHEIAEKITIIGKIAAKTDVLAINAAIEAARAGEGGKGFAVVAHEIRKLAENTQKAASEINDVVGNSIKTALNSEKLLSNIVPEIERTAILVQEINMASEEQNSGAEQVNNAIQELTKIIQENTGAANIIDEGSSSMSKQAAILEKTVAFFNTDFKDIYTAKENKVSLSKKGHTTLDTIDDNSDDNNFVSF